MKNPNRAGCNVIETIWVLKFPQVQCSLQLARKFALDQVAYANEAKGLKILKIILSAVKAGSVFFGRICTSVVNLAPASTRASAFI